MSKAISRDVLVAVFLLVVCGIFWVASYDIRTPDYGQLSPATWPRIIIGVMTFLSLIYFFLSVREASVPLWPYPKYQILQPAKIPKPKKLNH